MKRWSRWLGLALVACGTSERTGLIASSDGDRQTDSAATSGAPANAVVPDSAHGSTPMAEGAGTPELISNGERPAASANAGNGGPSAAPDVPPSPDATSPTSNASNPELEPPAAEALTCNLTGAAGPDTPTIWVIGDSTASVYASELYPRMGWAQPLQDYFSSACATIADRAISGRSSKSFFDEGAWAPVRDGLRAGDYVLIQFGHNDEKSDDPTRFTEPFTTFEQYLSIYIDDALAKSATPVLLTPIQRNKWNGAVLSDTHGQYPEAMRQLAAARDVALIDTSALTQSYFQRLGQAATTRLFMDLEVGQFPNYPDGNDDDTHLQEQGARSVAQLILADFARQKLPLGRLVQTLPVAP